MYAMALTFLFRGASDPTLVRKQNQTITTHGYFYLLVMDAAIILLMDVTIISTA